MKKFLSVILSVLFTFQAFSAVFAADSLTLGKIAWGTSADTSTRRATHNLAIDADLSTEWTTIYLGENEKASLYLDLGATTQSYNSVKLIASSLNTKALKVYGSNTLDETAATFSEVSAGGTFRAIPVLSSEVLLAGLTFDAPYQTGAGDLVLSFNMANYRYLRLENTTAYPSSASSQYGPLSVKEVSVNRAEPVSLTIDALQTNQISVPIVENKTVSIHASLKDAAGNEINSPEFSDIHYFLSGSYQGISLEEQTGLLTVTPQAQAGIIRISAVNQISLYPFSAEAELEITAADRGLYSVERIYELLSFDFIKGSNQTTDEVLTDLALLQSDANGRVTIGEETFENSGITWSSSNNDVVTQQGEVYRSGADSSIVLTALIHSGSHQKEKAISFTVKGIDYAPNLASGALGVTANSGWGNGMLAVDGKLTTYFNPGGHSTNEAGVTIVRADQSPFNQVVVYWWSPLNTDSLSLTAYQEGTLKVTGQYGSATLSGPIPLFSTTSAQYGNFIDSENKSVVNLNAVNTCQYLQFKLVGSGTKYGGIYEVMLYQKLPDTVEYTLEKPFRRPTKSGDTLSFNLPAVTKGYDIHGNVLTALPSYHWEYSGAEPGITVQGNTISLGSAFQKNEITLNLVLTNGTNIVGRRRVTIPATATTEDYYTLQSLKEQFSIGTNVNEALYLIEETKLPTSYKGASISYSCEAGWISADGTITRPSYDTGDQSTSVTAVLSLGTEQIVKTFEKVIIVKEMTDAQRVAADVALVTIPSSAPIEANLTLPAKGFYGSTLTWKSENTDYITNSGAYIENSGGGSKSVTLTVTASYNQATASKPITVFVKRSGNAPSESGGTGNSGSSGSKGSSYTAPSESASPVKEEIPAAVTSTGTFTDLPDTHWAKSYVSKLVKKGVISGNGDGTLVPDGDVTREQFVKMIMTAFAIHAEQITVPLNDADPESWYYYYVSTAYHLKIVNGMSENSFGIGMSLSRQDMAVILQNVLAFKGINAKRSAKEAFKDDGAIAGYAKDSVLALQEAGILSGDETGEFHPEQNATRAETMKLLCLAMELEVE